MNAGKDTNNIKIPFILEMCRKKVLIPELTKCFDSSFFLFFRRIFSPCWAKQDKLEVVRVDEDCVLGVCGSRMGRIGRSRRSNAFGFLLPSTHALSLH